MPRYFEGTFLPPKGRFAICVARFNAFITEELLHGALDTLVRHGVKDEDVDVFRVPGTFELPGLVKKVTETNRYAGVIALGCVIRGGTPHFEYVCDAVTDGLTRVALDERTPVGNGVLTCDNHDQAVDRSGGPGASEDKGAEACLAALHTAVLLRDLRKGP